MLAEIEAGFAAGPPGTPTTNPAECPPVTGQNQSATVHTPCVVDAAGEYPYPGVRITASGFKPNEAVNTELKGPTGETVEKFEDISKANANGNVLYTRQMGISEGETTGEYTLDVEGRESGHKAMGHYSFKAFFMPTPTPLPGFSNPVEAIVDTATGHNTPEGALKVTVPFRAEITLASPSDAAYFTFDITAKQSAEADRLDASLTNPYYAQPDSVVIAKLNPGNTLENDSSATMSTSIGGIMEGTYLMKITATGITAPVKEPIILKVTVVP